MPRNLQPSPPWSSPSPRLLFCFRHHRPLSPLLLPLLSLLLPLPSPLPQFLSMPLLVDCCLIVVVVAVAITVVVPVAITVTPVAVDVFVNDFSLLLVDCRHHHHHHRCCCHPCRCRRRHVLRGIPPIPVKSAFACLGGCPLLLQRIDAGRKASCGALEGHFCRRRPWL